MDRDRLRRCAAVAVVLVVIAWHVDPSPAEGRPGRGPAHDPPTAAPVTDPYRPPDHPYGPGNRGIEYDTAPGSPIRASSSGVVTFAGQVGGRLHVTVAHGAGLDTTYSWLDAVLVGRGGPVSRGQVIGLAGDVLHFGARRDGRYIDPALLFRPPVVEVRLVPLDGVIPRGGPVRGDAATPWVWPRIPR